MLLHMNNVRYLNIIKILWVNMDFYDEMIMTLSHNEKVIGAIGQIIKH